MTRAARYTLIAGLFLAVIGGVFYFHLLRSRVLHLTQAEDAEQGNGTEPAPPVTTPTDTIAPSQIYWASPDIEGQLDPVTVQIPLSADSTQRARQVIRELIDHPPTPAQRTLPPDVKLLAFYLLPDGTAIADFSDNIAAETPAGILSESLAVDSILRTLAANIPSLRRLKVLIHGQPAETLAGHLDLTGFFEASAAAAADPVTVATTALPGVH